jgi:hypothetical protein
MVKLAERTFTNNLGVSLIEYRSASKPLVSLFLRYHDGNGGRLYEVTKGLLGKTILSVWVANA